MIREEKTRKEKERFIEEEREMSRNRMMPPPPPPPYAPMMMAAMDMPKSAVSSSLRSADMSEVAFESRGLGGMMKRKAAPMMRNER